MHRLLVATLVLTACQTATESKTAAEPAPPKPIAKRAPATALPMRLIDHLDAQSVTSPLLDVAAVDTLAGSGSVPHDPVLELDFEGRAPGFPGPGCKVRPREDGRGKGLVYSGRNPHQCVFLIPAEPSAHYRVARAIHTDDPNIDFQVIESRSALAHPSELNHPSDIKATMNGRFVSMRQLLFVHHFERPRPGDWDGSALNLFTSPYTRSLVILLNDAEGLVRGRTERTSFDDIRVEKMSPSPQQELALLKSADRLRDDDDMGLAKHGQLLPVGLLSEVRAPFDHNYDFREAIFAPSPSRLSFALNELPDDARLRFSYGMHEASRPGDRTTFRVIAKPSFGDPQVLFEESLEAKDDQWHWHESRISLDVLAGQHVELILETESEGKRGYGLWGAPIVDAARPPKKPNVILIAVDTLRADRLSAYGYERKTSPTIDGLATDGITFDYALSGSNWTSPSFASIFTGRAPSRHQVVHRARSIPDAFHTLPEYFRDAGYLTEAVMYKAYLYNMGFEQGFDRYYNVPLHDVHAQSNLKKAMQWLDRNQDSPFFLFLHFNDPHQPFNQPKPFDTTFANRDDLHRFTLRLPITITGDNYVKGCRGCMNGNTVKKEFKQVGHDLYDGEIHFIDNRLGVFIDSLKERGLYDDTIIAFVADHGEMMWEHANTFGHGGPWLYDTLTRVPLIIKPHADFQGPRGAHVARSVQAYDVMPTLVQMAGLELRDEPRNAQSLVPLLDGTSDGSIEGEPCVTENVKQHVTAIVHDGWKLIVNHAPGSSLRTRLFHLRRDPMEQKDVARKYPERRKALERQLAEWIVSNRRGRFVWIQTGQEGKFRVKLRSEQPMRLARAWFGGSGKTNGGRELEIRGEGKSVFVELDLAEETTLAVQGAKDGQGTPIVSTRIETSRPVQYEKGMIERLAAGNSTSVTLFEGAPPVVHQETQQMNAQRLEALRALGYIQ